MTKPTADWELVLQRAKDAEERTERMEDEARRLSNELINNREWTHAIVTRALALCKTAIEGTCPEVVVELSGLQLREEDLTVIFRTNCVHTWTTNSGSALKLECTRCCLVMILDQAQLTDLAHERLERGARVVVMSDVTTANGRYSVLDREDHAPSDTEIAEAVAGIGESPLHIDAEFDYRDDDTEAPESPPQPDTRRHQITARHETSGGQHSLVVLGPPASAGIQTFGSQALLIVVDQAGGECRLELGSGAWTFGVVPLAEPAPHACARCGDALPADSLPARRYCVRCTDRLSRGAIVTPTVQSGVYIDVNGCKVFHPDGLKLVRDGTLRVEWFGKRVGHVILQNQVWLPRWYQNDGMPATGNVEAHTNVEAACNVVANHYGLNLTSSSLRISGDAFFANVGHLSDSGWAFNLWEGNTTRHEGFLTRDDACVAALSLVTELSQALGLYEP